MENKYNYPKFVNILYSALVLAENQIIRDYKELEYLQSGRNLPHNFASKLSDIILRKITDKFDVLAAQFGVIYNGKLIKEAVKDNYIVLNLLEDQHNLVRSLPFFTYNAAMAKYSDLDKEPDEIYSAVILNPIFNLFYWADNADQKVFEKNNLLKISRTEQKENANGVDDREVGLNLNSLSLETCFLASGKLDYIRREFDNPFQLVALIRILENAGAKFNIDYDNKIITVASTDNILKTLND